jgi:hypothetical protein
MERAKHLFAHGEDCVAGTSSAARLEWLDRMFVALCVQHVAEGRARAVRADACAGQI